VRSRLLFEWLLVAALAITTLCLLVSCRITERPDRLFYDAMMPLRPALASDVLIVAIDEDSLKSIGRWPWPRHIHASAIERLAAAGPKAIGYDVLFVEPSRDDAQVARAIARAGNVVLPITFSVPGINGAPFDPQLPVPPIASAARALGHADLQPESDGVVRRASVFAGNSQIHWPSMPEQVHRVITGKPSTAAMRSTNVPLPQAEFGLSHPLLIPFTGGTGFHRSVSFGAVLRGEVPPELLRGKIIMVGSTAKGSGDQYPVPGGAMPGVEILSNVIDALMEQRSISEATPGVVLAAALMPLLLLLGALLILPPRVNVVLGLGLMALCVAASAGLLVWADIWLPPSPALAGLLIVYPLWAWRRLEAANAYMVEELARLRSEPDTLPMGVAPPFAKGRYREAIARQTTLLHMAISRVRDLRRFFADSLQALPDPTVVTDRMGEVLFANRAADALFGPSVGLSIATLLDRLGRSGTEWQETGTYEVTAEDGRIFVLAIVLLRDAQGHRAGSIARLTDISEVRRAVRQREDALQLLTHDMRSPQASILALLERDGTDAPAARGRIADYARRTLKLADDFVNYARAESGHRSPELLDFVALMVEAADDQWALAEAKKIRIEVPETEEEYLVFGDRSLLARMLGNLIGNAIKYSESGTLVRCTIAREAGQGGAGELLCCRIEDQGHGIAAHDLGDIFQPFRRSRGVEGGGAGLGLAFVRAVVQSHGGTIAVESELGKGTTFILRFPSA